MQRHSKTSRRCSAREFDQDGWMLESVLSRWGHIDLVATMSGDRHSEVFVLKEGSAKDPERMLGIPELREMPEKRLSGPCKYSILYDGPDRAGMDGIYWLNLAEFLKETLIKAFPAGLPCKTARKP